MSSFANMFKIPELRNRIMFTLALLFIYRLGVFVTLPGVNQSLMKEMFAQTGSKTLFGMFNLFSGGALGQSSVFALGIMPYISSSIIFSLLAVVLPSVEKLQKEGHQGRMKINQYTRYLTVGISILQGLGISYWLETQKSNLGEAVVSEPGLGFRLMTIISLTAGTIFIMWLGEQITERGIGNGISLIIFSGIVAGFPGGAIQTIKFFQQRVLTPISLLIVLIIMLAAIAFIVFFERGQRRVPIQYARRIAGQQFLGQSTHLPLKVNTAGVIPPIFASSILLFPQTITNFFPNLEAVKQLQDYMKPGGTAYLTTYVLLIVFFAYFYTAVMFNPVDVAENLKKNGGFIPGLRPGKQTAEYLDKVLSRITFAGAAYMSIVCVLPTVLIQQFNVPFYFGGTSLMIVVGVALDTVSQIESHLITRHYEGFTGASGLRIRGRRG
ncbi:MAG: preprotein translocase subunit SecY [Myxococcota bacterium]